MRVAIAFFGHYDSELRVQKKKLFRSRCLNNDFHVQWYITSPRAYLSHMIVKFWRKLKAMLLRPKTKRGATKFRNRPFFNREAK